MSQIFVTVENILNPAVKRQMTLTSARINAKKWRIIGEETQELKKKEVAVSVAKPSVEKVIPVTEPLVKVEEPVKEESEFVQIGNEPSQEAQELEELRKQYFEKTGKQADKRMGKEKLTAKIAEA